MLVYWNLLALALKLPTTVFQQFFSTETSLEEVGTPPFPDSLPCLWASEAINLKPLHLAIILLLGFYPDSNSEAPEAAWVV